MRGRIVLYKGLQLVLDMAVGSSEKPVSKDRYQIWVDGLYREDVIQIPLWGKTFPSPSWRHFWPRSRAYCSHLFKKAVEKNRRGDSISGDLMLGRALHVLIDMSCPVHAQAVWHYLHDPFECYVEGHVKELSDLSLPSLTPRLNKGDPEKLVDSLAEEAQGERVDNTQSPWGRLLRRIKIRVKPKGLPVADQARRLIPLAAAHVKALMESYERELLR